MCVAAAEGEAGVEREACMNGEARVKGETGKRR